MPISHVGITVAHLAESTTLFLSCLAPLGYQFLIGMEHEVGLGVDFPDFFLAQETPRNPATNVHVAFLAKTRRAVDAFYDIAVASGAKEFDGPGLKPFAKNYYSASILDFDGNEIEVVSRQAIPIPPLLLLSPPVEEVRLGSKRSLAVHELRYGSDYCYSPPRSPKEGEHGRNPAKRVQRESESRLAVTVVGTKRMRSPRPTEKVVRWEDEVGGVV